MIRLNRISEEIFVAQERIVRFGGDEVAFLKQQAKRSPRKRARICAHRSTSDSLHEMLIAISVESYIRPHRHIGKTESFHIVEGEVDVVVFNEDGGIVEVVEMGPPSSGRQFFYRLSESAFHTLLILSDFLVVHEVTSGPFAKEDTILAPFAPREGDIEMAGSYIQQVRRSAAEYCASRG